MDPQGCRRIVMIVEPGELPRLQVTRYVNDSDGLQTAIEMLQLVPRAEAAPLDANDHPEPVVHYLGEMRTLGVKPGDTLVLSLQQSLSHEVAERIRCQMLTKFPENPVVVLCEGAELGVIRKDAA